MSVCGRLPRRVVASQRKCSTEPSENRVFAEWIDLHRSGGWQVACHRSRLRDDDRYATGNGFERAESVAFAERHERRSISAT